MSNQRAVSPAGDGEHKTLRALNQMTWDSYLELSFGAVVVALVLYDIFQSVVVPRWSSRRLRLTPLLLEVFWNFWRRLASRMEHGDAREDFLGMFAPMALMNSLMSWVFMLMFSFGLCFWALREQTHPQLKSFGEAFYMSGTTLLTIGYGDFSSHGGVSRVVSLAAGAAGLSIFALVISFLFTLYGAVETRETRVLMLDARAGSPPSGVALLQAYVELDLLSTLPTFFEEWEEWSAHLLQSHIAYPILPFFRSSHDSESWIASLGAVLDAATLLISTVKSAPNCGAQPLGAAKLMVRMGTHTLIDLGHYFGFRFEEATETHPHPGVERAEWEHACRQLEKAGFTLRDADEAWAQFTHFRSPYAPYLNELAKYFAAPPTQWIGDRSNISLYHRAPAQPSYIARKAHQETETAEL